MATVTQFKSFVSTQSGNDTAAEVEVGTNLTPGIDLAAWSLKAVEFTIKPSLMKAWANADSDFTLQITKRSMSGAIARLETFADQDLVFAYSLAMSAQGTPASWGISPASFLVELPVHQMIYSESLFVQGITTGTGQTNVVWGRLIYDIVALTKDQAFALLASRP